jgi:outer membrane protein OmpA-like peptidoglycan-associated protein
MPQPGAITIEFVAGSSDLPPGANDLLKELAATRGNGVIAVTGHGDVGSDDPAAQVTGLNLGLARAQAAAKALASDGVPTADVRVGAEAAGRGLDARLIQ